MEDNYGLDIYTEIKKLFMLYVFRSTTYTS